MAHALPIHIQYLIILLCDFYKNKVIYIFGQFEIFNRKTPTDDTEVGSDVAVIRAERDVDSNGRSIHEICFVANDGFGGICDGTLQVNIPTS